MLGLLLLILSCEEDPIVCYNEYMYNIGCFNNLTCWNEHNIDFIPKYIDAPLNCFWDEEVDDDYMINIECPNFIYRYSLR